METIPLFGPYALRRLRTEDAPDIFASIDTQRRYLGRWLPFVADTHRIEQTRQVVAGMLADTANPVFTLRSGNAFAVSVLEKSLEKDVIRGLKSAAGYLRRELGANMSLRYTPELQFIADDSIEYGAHILEMLRDPRVVKPANPENETLNTEDEQE